MSNGDNPVVQPLDGGTPPLGGESTLPPGTLWGMGALLCLFALIVCFTGIGSGPPLGDHECIAAQTARQTIQSGNWLVPQLAEIPRIRKTPLGIWSIAVTSWLLDDPAKQPVTDLSARLPSALAAFLNALAVWWLGAMMFGKRAGLVAGFIMGCCAATILYSHSAQVDMLLALFTTLTFACFWRAFEHERPSKAFVIVMFVVFSAAMMAKAPLPMATAGLALTLWWFVTTPLLNSAAKPSPDGLARSVSSIAVEQAIRLPWNWVLAGLAIFIVLAGAWPLYILLNVKNAAALWNMEYLERFSGGIGERNKSQPFHYYVPLVFGLVAPFLFSLPEGLAALFLKRYRAHRRGLAFALTWAFCGLVFLSIASYKRPHYLLSIVPAYCLLLAPVIDRLFFGAVSRLARPTAIAIPVMLGISMVVGGIYVQRTYHAEYEGILSSYLKLALPVFGLLTASCVLYATGRRTWSFILLNAGTVLLTVLGVPAARQFMDVNTEPKALAAGLREHGVDLSATIYWVGGRPNTSVEFYSGYRIQRLINELEMTELRKDRMSVEDDLLREFEKRIRAKLAEPKPVYFIMSSGNVEMMRRETELRPRVVFELKGFADQPGKELMVITQPEPATSLPASRSAG